jgi:2-keto-4-pentenoate hydratase/2-oxohepta-3-ene-1,7-dioic acid hydratase in catechol pathway
VRLVRVGARGAEQPGLLKADHQVIDVSSVVDDYDTRFWGEGGPAFLAAELRAGRLDRLPVLDTSSTRLGPPVARPGKLICVGLNYRDHAAETGAKVPDKPVLFTKAVTAINGPNDDIVLPSNYATTDWEVELAFVTGPRARRVSRDRALEHVAGYLICHDVSERQAQISEGGQWFRGKSFDTYGPLGPWVATPDEVGDPHALDLTLDVNGERMQTGSTSRMIFGVNFLVAYISRFMRLEAGDVITTGTPPGVGLGMKPPRYLRANDRVALGIEGLGTQAQLVNCS